MAGYKIRSITLHAPGHMAEDVLSDVDDVLARLQDAVDTAIQQTGLQVETHRLVADIGDPARLPEAPDVLGEAAKSYGALLSIGPVPVRLAQERWDILSDIIDNGIFFNMIMEKASWEEALAASEMVHDAAERDPSLATLFGVNVYGRPVVTPYYPLASSPVDGGLAVSVSLTYPNYLLEAYKRGGFDGLVAAIEEAGGRALEALDIVASKLGARPLGVDLSVAPWMEESSLALVEYVAGVRMPEPGFLLGIYTVNRALSDAAKRVERAVGFNELQLPVAEDLKLKKRVAELDTTARDLARFSCVCLAGLDLAVVPASVRGVAGLMLDVAACSRAKDKPLGVRIVPLEDVDPGEKVWLEKFGETPVIEL